MPGFGVLPPGEELPRPPDTRIFVGEHQILVDSTFNVQDLGKLTFVGSGTNRPVFLVTERSSIQHFGKLIVTGEGGVGLEMGHNSVLFGAEVVAEGAGATAVRAHGQINLQKAELRAPRGTGLVCEGKAYLEGECVIDALQNDMGDTRAELSYISPMPDEVDIAWRQATAWCDPATRSDLLSQGLNMRQGSSAALPDELNITLWLKDSEDTPAYILPVGVDWELPPDFDADRPGIYTATMAPSLPLWATTMVEDIGPQAVKLHVVAPGTLWIDSITLADEWWAPPVLMSFVWPLEEDEELRLYQSQDRGNTWSLLTQGVEVFDDSLQIVGLEDETLYWFYVEAGPEGSAKKSNVGTHWYSEEGTSGGNRDLDDRKGDSDVSPPDPPPGPGDKNTQSGGETGRESDDDASDSGGDGSLAALEQSLPELPAAESPPAPQANAEEAAPAAESSSRATGSPAALPMNRENLALLGEAGAGVLTFAQNQIKLMVSAQAVAGLLEEGETLEVLLSMQDSGSFFIRFLAGERELTHLGEKSFEVHVPYEGFSGQASDISCVHESGAATPASEYRNNKLVFWLTAAGSYTLRVEQEEAATAMAVAELPGNPPSEDSVAAEGPAAAARPYRPAVLAGTLAALLAAGFLLHRRGRRANR